MGQWLWGFMCLYNPGTPFHKNQKQQNGRLYTQKLWKALLWKKNDIKL